MKLYIRATTEAYNYDLMRKLSAQAERVCREVHAVLNGGETSDPVATEICSAIETYPTYDGTVRLCFAVVDPKTKIVEYSDSNPLLFYALSEADYRQKCASYAGKRIKTLYATKNDNLTLDVTSDDTLIQTASTAVAAIRSEIDADATYEWDHSYVTGIRIDLTCGSISHVIVLASTYTKGVEISHTFYSDGLILSVGPDADKSAIKRGIDKLMKLLRSAATETKVANARLSNISEAADRVDINDYESFEEFYDEFLSDAEHTINHDLNIFVEPSIQGGHGVVFITDNDNPDNEVRVDFSDWCDNELEMALNSKNESDYAAKYEVYVMNLCSWL